MKDTLAGLKQSDVTEKPNAKLERMMHDLAHHARDLDDLGLATYRMQLDKFGATLPRATPVDIGNLSITRTIDQKRQIIAVRIGGVSSVFVFNDDGRQLGTPMPLDWIYDFKVNVLSLRDGLLISGEKLTITDGKVDTRLWFAPRSQRGYAISRVQVGSWFSPPRALRPWLSVNESEIQFRYIVPLRWIALKPGLLPPVHTKIFEATVSRPVARSGGDKAGALIAIDESLIEAKAHGTLSEAETRLADLAGRGSLIVDDYSITHSNDGSTPVQIKSPNERFLVVVRRRRVVDVQLIRR